VSHVTDFIITTALLDEDIDFPPEWRIKDVSDNNGGDKAFQACVYLLALDYTVIEETVQTIFGLPWEMPEGVQVFVKDEHDERFTERFGWTRTK